MARYRIRTELRGILPAVLASLIPKGRDCGAHEWYRSDETTDRCYHCSAGVRAHRDASTPAAAETGYIVWRPRGHAGAPRVRND